MKKATFGAGCFWGVEKLFRKEFGDKLDMYVGYMGGKAANPTYEDICTGKTGHAEVLQIQFNEPVTYKDLVKFFFRIHDPTTLNKQQNDVGTQYRSVIFTEDDEQFNQAKKVIDELKNPKIVTEIVPVTDNLKFWKAETYHQKYLEKNPQGYCSHRIRS
eukprot:GHVL01014513.1.p1 GENE.GHVL01014513.1~~GHVL01014513.1.p1  ORF type:complete len:159 (+),score=39.77 GHVL01014513.1:118-594(+)